MRELMLSVLLMLLVGGMMWRVVLDEVSDSSPFTITATLEDDRVSPQKIQIKNVLFGDVWICAGQENMQFSVDKVSMEMAALAKLTVHNPMMKDCLQLTL